MVTLLLPLDVTPGLPRPSCSREERAVSDGSPHGEEGGAESITAWAWPPRACSLSATDSLQQGESGRQNRTGGEGRKGKRGAGLAPALQCAAWGPGHHVPPGDGGRGTGGGGAKPCRDPRDPRKETNISLVIQVLKSMLKKGQT